MRIAFVTQADLPNLADDDRLLIEPLASLGVDAVPAVWSDAAVDWTAFDALMIRSCWDYHLQPERFFAWVARVEALGVPIWNPAAILRWNSDKGYLRDLAARGATVIPTLWIGPGDVPPLRDVLDDAGWDEVVIKPAISAAAHDTWRISRADADANDARFQAAARDRQLLVQPYVPEIVAAGEWSLLFAADRFSHAVLKRPRTGDFRVQEHLGGTSVRSDPPGFVIAEAARIVQSVGTPLLYARVDGCVRNGAFHLMEFEALEPSLFLVADPEAPKRFAEAIATKLR